MKKNIELSSEMNQILERTNSYSRNLKHSVITVESLMYNILDLYIKSDMYSLECMSLKRVLNKMNSTELESLLNFCKNSAESVSTKNVKFSGPDCLYFEDGLPLSSELGGIFVSSAEVLDMATEATKSFGSLIKRKLGTLEIVAGLLNPTLGNHFLDCLMGKYSLNDKEFLGQVMLDSSSDQQVINSKLLAEDFLNGGESKLRAKRVDFGEDSGVEKFFGRYEGDLPENNKDNKNSEDEPSMTASTGSMSSRKANPDSKTPTLDQFATDMTQNAIDGQYDPVVGREREIRELIEILCCRKKNNAILLGDPGCGKTAIVECLAQRIVKGDVPRELKGHRIMSLSTTDLLAGTMYRGQAEERVQKLCKELKENRDIILYMDEFHQATSENQTSISDMLKPSLGRGEVTMIASTTVTEFKKYVEKDGALKRRFQKVLVEEPTTEETIAILQGLSDKYEEFHHVRYTDEVIKACVEWADKYIYDRKSPDKAIDLMDTAGAHTKLLRSVDMNAIESMEKEIEELSSKKISLVEKDELKEAAEVKDIMDEKKAQLEELKKNFDLDKTKWPVVTLDCVAKVVSDLTNIPSDKINNPEIAKLRGMKESLMKKIIGQDEGVKSASLSLSKSFLGLRDETKPVASLMFVGPTGVGKTLLCEEICETIYGDKKAMLRIDCGEYSQPHTITKLLGAPASYVGYGEPGIFDAIRERPNSLVLFDEIEKMHPEIINTLFLNIMSTGMIKMSNGVDVSFRNCIIVFTGNVGTKELQLNGNGIGFGTATAAEKKKADYDIVMKAIKKQFRPEFINRLSGITVFNELSEEDMNKIFDLELNKLKERLSKRGYNLEVSEELKQLIIKNTDTKYGARDLARGITKYVEDKICETMLEKDVSGMFNILVSKADDQSVAEFTK